MLFSFSDDLENHLTNSIKIINAFEFEFLKQDISINFFDPLEGFDIDLDTSLFFLIEFQFFGIADFFPFIVAMISGFVYIMVDEFEILEEELEDMQELIADDLSSVEEDDFESDQVDMSSSGNFWFIAFGNLLGMLPYGSGLGSSLFFIFAYSFFSLLFINIFGLIKHKFRFFSLFLPEGTPLIMSPFIVVVEFISYIARVFSISIRLFANLMSGHTLLKILSSFTWILIITFNFVVFIAIISLLLIFVIFSLETIIAVLQAYVYTLLSCIYINDVFKLH